MLPFPFNHKLLVLFNPRSLALHNRYGTPRLSDFGVAQAQPVTPNGVTMRAIHL